MAVVINSNNYIGTAEEMPTRIVVVIVLEENNSLKTINTATSSKLHIVYPRGTPRGTRSLSTCNLVTVTSSLKSLARVI